MANPEAQSLCRAVEALTRSHAHAPADDVLALVMHGREGQALDFGEASAEHGSLVSPRSTFGQVLAAVFDRAAPPGEWMTSTGPDAHALVRQAMLIIWQEQVVSRFEAAYAVTCTGLPNVASTTWNGGVPTDGSASAGSEGCSDCSASVDLEH